MERHSYWEKKDGVFFSRRPQSVEKLKIKRGAIAPQKGFGDEGLQPLSPLLHFVQHLPAPRGVTRNIAAPPLGEGLGLLPTGWGDGTK